MPTDNSSDDDSNTQSQIADFDNDDDSIQSSLQISDDEDSSRDDYLNKLGKIVEQIQEELESEVGNNSDGISVDAEKALEAIQTLAELLDVRARQLEEKDLPTHVDEKVEEYR